MTRLEAQLFMPEQGESPQEIVGRFEIQSHHITYGQPGRLGWSAGIPRFDRPIYLALRRIEGSLAGINFGLFSFRLRRPLASLVEREESADRFGIRDSLNVQFDPEVDLGATDAWVSYPLGIDEEVEIVDVVAHFASAIPTPE